MAHGSDPTDPYRYVQYCAVMIIQSLTKVLSVVQIDLKCPSNILLINIFLQEMAHFNPNSFWNNVLVQNETVEKYSNVHSLVKPLSKFCKDKSLVALSYDAPNPRLELHL